MLKIFISQKMSGLELKDIINNRNMGIDRMLDLLGIPESEIEVIDNLQLDLPEGTSNFVYLGNDIKKLEMVDLVCFIDDHKSRGCQVEYLTAKLYNIPILEL